jgi:hypothetical protein
MLSNDEQRIYSDESRDDARYQRDFFRRMLVSVRRYSMMRPWLDVVVLTIILVGLRWLFPERPVDYTGPRALLDAGFALGMLGLMLLLAGGLGRKVQRNLELEGLARLEQAVFGLAIGLGIVAYGILVISLAGLLRPWAILLWLILVSIWTWSDWRAIADNIPGWLRDGFQAWHKLGFGKKLLLIVMGLILVLTLLQTLSPPTDPDGMIDHLQVSKLFLQAGRMYPMPDLVFANYPFTVELLFASGMAFGSDTFAKLIHLTYAVLLVLGVFALGWRFLGSEGGWIAAAVLVGMPIIPIWSSLAYIDMGWTLYEFLGVYAVILWAARDQRRWLVLAGLMIGLALGSKYLALGGAAAIGLWILWHTRAQGWRTVLVSAMLFGGTALLVSAPWFVKNWWWLGNPVYPYFGDATHTALSTKEPYAWWEYLVLPWRLYVHREQFVGAYGSIEFPSLLFPLVFLYVWVRRPKAMNWLAGLTLLRYVFWALVSYARFRYMLPVLPGLSLLVSCVVMDLTARPRFQRWGKVLVIGLIGGMLVTTLIYSVLFFVDVQPLDVIVGLESKDSFLRREVSDYAAKQFVQANLPREARVLMMWDARGYYCDERCLPDLLRRQWVDLTMPTASVSSVAGRLREMNITHLLFSIEDLDYLLVNDSSETYQRAAQFFLHEFRPECTQEVYRDEWVTVFEFTCR